MPPTRLPLVLGLAALAVPVGWVFFFNTPTRPTPPRVSISSRTPADSPATPELFTRPAFATVFEPEAFDELIAVREAVRNAPGATLAWAAGLTDPQARTEMIGLICQQIAQTDPRAAIEAATSHLAPPDARIPLQSLAQTWALADFDSALAWATRHPAGDFRDALVASVTSARATAAPQDALQLLARHMPVGPAQDHARLEIIQSWALSNRTAATRCAESLPLGPLRVEALNLLAQLSDVSTARE